MQLPDFLDGEPPDWQTWLVPVVGFAAAVLTLSAGRLVLSRWRGAPARPNIPTPERPAHDPFEKGSLTERRRALRRKGNPIEIRVSDAEATVEPITAWVIDRSMGGLCVLTDEEVAEGTVLSVKAANSPPGTPWVRVEVRSIKHTKHGYELGCQFVRVPPTSILLLFG
jgi:hypothetical protein